MSSVGATRRRDDGFTLLEILVAFTVAALLLSAGMRALSVDIGGVAQSRAQTEAVMLASSALEEVGVTIPLREGDQTEPVGGGFVRRIVIARATIDIKGEGPPQAIPYDVDSTVAWTSGGRERSISLRTIRLGPIR
jgi:general secretion pathway protein I